VRIICFIILGLALFCGQSFAAAPVSADFIAAAQEYGHKNAKIPLVEFLGPWTVFEENAVKLDETTERATLYTPFLLIAADARDKTLDRQDVSFGDGEKVLADYNGYIVFGVTVFGSDPAFAGKATAVLKQGKKKVKAKIYNVSSAPEKTAWSLERSPTFVIQSYIYFSTRDISLAKPATLQITVRDKRSYRFYFDFLQFR
jgi:hypothetical protein